MKEMSKVVDGLRGDAAQIAIDLGTSKILGATGLTDLIEAMRASVFPQARAEAKELYKVGHKVKGVLSRQPGEPMVNFISRRRRWWRQLKEMDSTVTLSPSILGDLMLESSGLSDVEQLMVLTSTDNNREFDVVAQALLEQHSKAHLKESWKQQDRKKSRRSHLRSTIWQRDSFCVSI